MLVNPVAGRPVVAMCWDTLAIGVHVGDCFPGYGDRDGLTQPWKELCRMSSNKLRSQTQALQHLQAIIEAEQGSATPREGVAGSIVRLVRHLDYERSRDSGDVRGTWAVR